MMRWNAQLTADVDGAEDTDRSPSALLGGKQGPEAVQYVLAAVVDTVARIGGGTVIGTVMLALVVVALLLGLSVEEATALSRWCPNCK